MSLTSEWAGGLPRDGVRFARRVFTAAGVWGVLVVFPLYFLESWVGARQPPPVTHPEFYYGFVGVTLAWQILFFVVARDPVRHRPLMPVAVVEKLGYGLAVPLLYAAGRVPEAALFPALPDLIWLALFAAAYLRTRARSAATRPPPTKVRPLV